MDLPDPPEGWRLKGLNEVDGKWLAFLYSADAYVCAGGTTPRYAMLDALTRIEEGTVYATLSGMTKAPEPDLVAILGIKPAPLKRRA